MKKLIWIVVVTLALIMTNSLQVYADRGGGGHGGHGGHGGRSSFSIMVGPGWWGWPFYPYYPYYPAPPVVIEKEPQVYMQQEESNYWYYCPDSRGYYPDVKKCPQGWLKVVPSVPPGEEPR